jgi:short-subunit dehydrogenase
MVLVNIVGGNGGMGSAITEKLSEYYTVRSIDREENVADPNCDVLILNAGVGFFGNLEDCTSDKIKDMMWINVERHIRIVQSVIKRWKQRKSGHMVFIASNSAYEGFPANNVYSASKGAILMFARSLMKELRNFNIKVSVLSPGTTDTGFWNSAGNDNRGKCIPVTPVEIANTVDFILACPSMISEMIILPRPTEDLSMVQK